MDDYLIKLDKIFILSRIGINKYDRGIFVKKRRLVSIHHINHLVTKGLVAMIVSVEVI
jgi:hypothetical protein